MEKIMVLKIFRWACVLALSILTLFLMLTPGVKLPYNFFGDLTDKVGHFVLFGTLAVTWYWALTGHIPRLRAARIAIIVVLVFGTVTELAQFYVPQREVSFWDLVANWTGTFLGIGLFFLARTRLSPMVGSQNDFPA
jgi:VanZ family protein